MVISQNVTKRDCKEAILLIQEFRKLYLKQPLSGTGFLISEWDIKIVKNYFSLKSKLKIKFKSERKIFLLVEGLPSYVWILKKYVFECIFFPFMLFISIVYLIKVPVFKGKLSYFIPVIMLIYFFFREWLRYKGQDISIQIHEIEEKIVELHSFIEEYEKKIANKN